MAKLFAFTFVSTTTGRKLRGRLNIRAVWLEHFLLAPALRVPPTPHMLTKAA
jgi:hypothetical protein